MMNPDIQRIDNISLHITLRCPVQCRFCMRKCTGEPQKPISKELAYQIIDVIAQPPFSHPGLTLTGGEPFLELELMRSIIYHATSKKIVTSIFTNCVWASNFETTLSILRDLQHLGLWGLIVSVDDEHQRVVPLDNVADVITVCHMLGIIVYVRTTDLYNNTTPSAVWWNEIQERMLLKPDPSVYLPIQASVRRSWWLQFPIKTRILHNTIMPTSKEHNRMYGQRGWILEELENMLSLLRKTVNMYKTTWPQIPNINPDGACFRSLIIDPDGTVRWPIAKIGNLYENGLIQLLENAIKTTIYGILKNGNPAKLAQVFDELYDTNFCAETYTSYSHFYFRFFSQFTFDGNLKT